MADWGMWWGGFLAGVGLTMMAFGTLITVVAR
jgi:hypothetical protein